MKKILAIALTLIMVLSASAMALTSSAVGVNPYFTADKSVLTFVSGVSQVVGTVNGTKIAFDHDYTCTFNTEKTTDGKTVVWTVTDNTVQASCWGAKVASVLKCAGFRFVNGTLYSADYVVGEEASIYRGIISTPVNNGVGAELKSMIVTVGPKGSKWGNTVIDGFTVYATDSDTPWLKVDGGNGFTGKKLCEVKNLNTEDKWLTSEDGTFRYYELNFEEAYKATYFVFCLTVDDMASIDTDESMEQQPVFLCPEIAAFSEAIPGADTYKAVDFVPTQITETTAEETTAAATEAVTTAAETKAPETKAPETKAPETEAQTEVEATQAETEAAPAETKAPETEAPAKKSGCSSTLALMAPVLTLAAAFVCRRKKD